MDASPRDSWTTDVAPLPRHVLPALTSLWAGSARTAPAVQAPPSAAELAAAAGPPAHSAAAGPPAHSAAATPSADAAPDMPPREPLTGEARDALVKAVGAAQVLTDEASRAAHAGGLSYLDLLRRSLQADAVLPDAVVLPSGHDEVQAVLDACREHDVAVVPFGGGTSVVGGVEALRGGKPAVIALDLNRLDGLVDVDQTSRLATLQAGLTGPVAEKLLARRGLTLGHVPQSFERATIGGFAVTRSAGQASSGYGRFEDMVHGLRLATPRGQWLVGGRAPASAAGPDLRALVSGSEGAFGVVTEVTLRVRPLPTHRRYECVVLDGWQRGVDAVRALAQGHALADVTRLSDVTETGVAFTLKGGLTTAAVRRYLRVRNVKAPCLLVLGWEAGSEHELRARRAATRRLLRPFRPVALGRSAGESWRHGRFAGPRQRDALMARGVCVETLETAARWSAVPALTSAIRGALQEALGRAVVMCHVSHAYETGASLYFTVLAPRDPEHPQAQWQRAKHAASEAIAANGATITHHHAVGLDHRPWLEAEIGPLGVQTLQAIKQTLDPTGIMNPGKLLAPQPR